MLDLRVIKTRQNIQSHFIALLNHYPFQDITIKMLIDECKINRSTFYRNYEDKYDLLNKIADDLLEKYQRTIRAEIVTMQTTNSENLNTYVLPLVNYFDKYKDTLRPLSKHYIPIHLFDSMAEIMSACFLEEIKTSYSIKESEIKTSFYYVNLITNNILTTMKWWHFTCPELSKQEIIGILNSCITKGVFFSMQELIDK